MTAFCGLIVGVGTGGTVRLTAAWYRKEEKVLTYRGW
jgi:hypothetical protein